MQANTMQNIGLVFSGNCNSRHVKANTQPSRHHCELLHLKSTQVNKERNLQL